MKNIFIAIFSTMFLFASSENISLMNSVKSLIQKEEYIALALNKYISQTGKIPKKSNGELDWDKLVKNDKKGDYLGTSFDKKNPLTSKDLKVTFDAKNNCRIYGLFDNKAYFNEQYKYLYNFYINKLFRINTNPPKSIDGEDLAKGSYVLYGKFQQDIVNLVTDNNHQIRLPSEKCPTNNYYYELRNQKVVYKYCKGDYSFDIYQTAPIYLENWEDLSYIKAKVGDVAYIKKNGSWYEYTYQGDVDIPWIPVESGSALNSQDDTLDVEDRLISYIPDAKDLVIRRDGGCMLANGDIFCWGNNDFKKAGISSYGQLDHNLSPDYVNTPVMLKVQISDSTQNSKKWYNNPYRVKFEKMSMNSTNVCGISPIFDYFQAGQYLKYGGDLYCNGQISSESFEDIASGLGQSAILRKHKLFAQDKSDLLNNANEKYLIDIAMTEDTIAVLSDDGKIYTLGRNYKGALGIGSSDKFINQTVPVAINNNSQIFKKVFALRDIRCFGAIDSNNQFWIWGERPNGAVLYEPTLLSAGKKFNPDMIFVNSSDFVLRGLDNSYYRTYDTLDLGGMNYIPNSAINVSIYDDSLGNSFYLYVDESMQLQGTASLKECRLANETSSCSITGAKVFKMAFDELNTKSNLINGKEYANFANAAIYKLDHITTDAEDDFEGGVATGWSNGTVTTVANDGTAGRIPVTTFLGRFQIGNASTEKTYDFGTTYAHKDVEVEFDFYEIDSWDYEKFIVELNGEKLVEDAFIHDNHPTYQDSKDNGELLQNVGTHYSGNEKYNDYKYRYKLKSKLDSQGKIKVRFTTRLLTNGEVGENSWSNSLQNIWDESWGVDNIHIKVKETNKKFVCTMTGLGSSSQMYCWGNIARSVPILSTSLYDVSKIATINKLFVTKESERKSQMSYNEYHDEGKLFLKYPTYIGGFDYEFYFK